MTERALSNQIHNNIHAVNEVVRCQTEARSLAFGDFHTDITAGVAPTKWNTMRQVKFAVDVICQPEEGNDE